MGDPAPKKRPRRDVKSTYADEEKPRVVVQAAPSHERTNPSRVFPSLPGFMPLNKQEIRLDSAEIERKGASAVDTTDSEDDEESVSLPGFISGSSRPPCAPDSSLFGKKARYYQWATHPESMDSDLREYRACVDALERRLAECSRADSEWADRVELARLELSELHASLKHKSGQLEREGGQLLRVLCGLTGVATGIAEGEDPSTVLSAKKAASATALAVERLWGDGEALQTTLLIAAAADEKKNSSHPRVYMYTPETTTSGESAAVEEADVDDVCDLLEDVRGGAAALSAEKPGRRRKFSDSGVPAAYKKWVASLVERQAALSAGESTEEREARVLRAVALSDSFCAAQLQLMCDSLGSETNKRDNTSRRDSSAATQDSKGDNTTGLLEGRSARRRRPSTLAAEAGLDIAGISAPSPEEQEPEEAAEEDAGPSDGSTILTRASILRRTPRGVPLILSESSAMEDCFVGVFGELAQSRCSEMRVEDLETCGADGLPHFLQAQEKKEVLSTYLRGALCRAERAMFTLERERGEWMSQLESSRNVALRASETLSLVQSDTDFQPPRQEAEIEERQQAEAVREVEGGGDKPPARAASLAGRKRSEPSPVKEETTAAEKSAPSGGGAGGRKPPKRRR